MRPIFSLTILGCSLALALGSAQAQTVAPSETPAPAATATAAPATPPAPRPSRARGKVARGLPPPKICNVQVNAQKGEDRTAELAACIKK